MKFTPYEKLSKKAKRAEDLRRRGNWGAVSPVTRRAQSEKIYDRKKTRRWSDDSAGVSFVFHVTAQEWT